MNGTEKEMTEQYAAGLWQTGPAPKDGMWLLCHNWFGDFVAVRWDANSRAWIDFRGQGGFDGDPDPWAAINRPEAGAMTDGLPEEQLD